MARRQLGQCSFCGKAQDQVRKLVAGPGVYICDGCIQLCNEVISTEPPRRPQDGSPGQWVATTGLVCRNGPLGWFRNLFRQQVRQQA
jgi:hypothetical protein